MRLYRQETRNQAAASPRAARLAAKITRLQQQRAAMASQERMSLGECLPKDPDKRNEVYRFLLKLPLISDFLYAACVDLQSLLKTYNMDELTLSARVKSIRDMAKELAFTLSGFPDLEAILSADDTLIDALDKKLDSFLSRRMNITP